jgi:hypothetical protein
LVRAAATAVPIVEADGAATAVPIDAAVGGVKVVTVAEGRETGSGLAKAAAMAAAVGGVSEEMSPEVSATVPETGCVTPDPSTRSL